MADKQLTWRLISPEEEAAEFARAVESHHREAWEQAGTCFACLVDAPEYCVCARLKAYLLDHPEPAMAESGNQ
ncbi:hypothetical protein [Prescottella agglutinans]|uniref:hypothetical protein n=1 Tax=Prescottella agglutinans TaxID=1644129 RepID=UPI0024736194|nr:hypothetical protein [Prescottella agglutinans]